MANKIPAHLDERDRVWADAYILVYVNGLYPKKELQINSKLHFYDKFNTFSNFTQRDCNY